MDRENVFDLFCRFTGLDSTRAQDCFFMCDTACDYVLSRIREGADISEGSGALELAAAALAYYRYVLWELTSGAEREIRVGEISVRAAGTSRLEAAEYLCRDAFESIGCYLSDEGFVFRGIGYE